MSDVVITITRDSMTPMLARLADAASLDGISLVMGRAAGTLIKDWLYDLNGERHRYGHNFYSQAADSVTVTKASSGAIISITQLGFRQRLMGGEIKPGPGKTYLTIPASPEAYGHRAGEFNDLDFKVVLDENGSLRPALVRRASTALKFTRRKQKDGTIKTTIKAGDVRGGEVMFWLVKHVNQHPDASVLPPGDLIVATAVQAGARRLARLSAPPADPSNN